MRLVWLHKYVTGGKLVKYHIVAMGGDDSMTVETRGHTVEVWTFGPRGGVKGFVVLDKDEFRNLLQALLRDEALK